MSAFGFHLVALLIGAAILAAFGGIVWIVVQTGRSGEIIFYCIAGGMAAYCFGRAVLAIMGIYR